MRIFVINLARNPERLARMQTLLTDRGLAFERLDAVDGRQIGEDVVARWSDRQADGSLCLSPSEVGCMLSHRHAWERIAAMEGGYGVVLEDDVHLSQDAATFLAKSDWIPADAEIVKIETVLWKTAVSKASFPAEPGHYTARLLDQHFGTGGYIVTPAGARRLLDEIGRVHMAIDQIMFDPASELFHRLAIYQIIPALCIQDQFLDAADPAMGGEVTRAWRLNRKPRTFAQKAVREWNRLTAQIGRAVAGSRFNPLSRRVNVRVDFPADISR